MICNEFHVESLRQRGVTWDEMTDDDRVAVVADKVYQRITGRGGLTRRDLVELHDGANKKRDPTEERTTTNETLSRLAAMRQSRDFSPTGVRS